MQYVVFLSRRNLKHKVQISGLSPAIEKKKFWSQNGEHNCVLDSLDSVALLNQSIFVEYFENIMCTENHY